MSQPHVHLRRITRQDVPRLAVLPGQLGYPAGDSAVDERLDYWLNDPASADIGGELAGVAALHVSPLPEVTGKWARLVALVVDEQHCDRGIGRNLVGAAESRAEESGVASEWRLRAAARETTPTASTADRDTKTSASGRHGS